MKSALRCFCTLMACCVIGASDARAQFADAVNQTTSLRLAAPAPAAETALQQPGALRPLRIAKWTVAAATAGVALYGFVNNNRADDLYRELEEMCVADRSRCDNRLPGGAYADAEMEALYQDVRNLDGRARSALIAGQVGLAASVVLFILDLRNHGTPPNIPYEPPGFRVAPASDGGFSFSFQVREPGK